MNTFTNDPVSPDYVDPAHVPAFGVCVTTMNRVDTLAACLGNLERCAPRADCVVVSDDSPDAATRAANAAVVAQHPGVVYLEGPRRGVCANRNNAMRHCLAHRPECDYVSFVDDDIQLAVDFFAVARDRLAQLTPARRHSVILTGGASSGPHIHECRPLRLSFMGYFTEGDAPQCVNIHAAVFPAALFRHDEWDENIFFGIEDAELLLRALRAGHSIELVPALRARDTLPGSGVLHSRDPRGGLTRYQVNCEAARLYVGIKRYGRIEPDVLKLCAFTSWYFIHLLLYLVRRKSIGSLVPIIRRSNVVRVVGPRKAI